MPKKVKVNKNYVLVESEGTGMTTKIFSVVNGKKTAIPLVTDALWEVKAGSVGWLILRIAVPRLKIKVDLKNTSRIEP